MVCAPRSTLARSLLALMLSLGLAPLVRAQAAPLPPVELLESACAGASLEDLLTALRVELRDQLRESESTEPVYRVLVRCTDDMLFVRVLAPNGKVQSFETRLKDTDDDVRSRVVALAVAEVARDLEPIEPEPRPVLPAPPPAEEKPPVRSIEPEPVVEPDLMRSYELGAFAQGSHFTGNSTGVIGGGIALVYGLSFLHFGIDVAVLTAHNDVALGTTRAFVSYAEPAIGLRTVWSRVRGSAGFAFAMGSTRLSARARAPGANDGEFHTPFLAPALFGQVSTRVVSDLTLFLKLQLGWVLAPAVGQVRGGKDVEVSDVWTSLSLGAAYSIERKVR